MQTMVKYPGYLTDAGIVQFLLQEPSTKNNFHLIFTSTIFVALF